MNRFLQTIAVGLLSVSFSLPAQAKPFQRALVFSGGGFSVPAYIGMYDAAIENGFYPDVVIGTCGSSISVALINAFQDKHERLAFLYSPRFQRFLRLPQTKTGAFNGLLHLLYQLNNSPEGEPGSKVLDMFGTTLFHLPNQLEVGAKFRHPIQRSLSRTVIIAAETNSLSPASVGKTFTPNKKYFKETVFTDTETARFLEGAPSQTGTMFPRSRVAPTLNIRTDFSLQDAVRASVAEPFLMNPKRKDGKYYFGSYVNLFPVTIAKRLASEIAMTVPSIAETTTDQTILHSYGFSANKQSYCMRTQKGIQHFIDITDKNKIDNTLGMAYKIKASASAPGWIAFRNTVPEDHREYRLRMQAMYRWGYRRMVEALRKPEGSQSHLRNPTQPGLYECQQW